MPIAVDTLRNDGFGDPAIASFLTSERTLWVGDWLTEPLTERLIRDAARYAADGPSALVRSDAFASLTPEQRARVERFLRYDI